MRSDEIVDILERIGAEKISVTTRNVWCRCPLAPWSHENKSDRTPSCSIKIVPGDTSVFICWSCKQKGTFSDLIFYLNQFSKGIKPLGPYEDIVIEVEEKDKPDLGAQLEFAMGRYREGGSIPPLKDPGISTDERRTFDDEEIASYVGSVPKYIIDRGITTDTCKAWELGFDREERDPRLVFPIRDFEGNLVGMVGRAVREDARVKYKNYWGFESEKFLYGEHKIDPDDTTRPIIIVEGMVDVLWLWQGGIGQPLGLLGSEITDTKRDKLQAFAGSRAIFTFFDADKAGDIARGVVQRGLGEVCPIFNFSPPRGSDPAETPHDTIRKIIPLAA